MIKRLTEMFPALDPDDVYNRSFNWARMWLVTQRIEADFNDRIRDAQKAEMEAKNKS